MGRDKEPRNYQTRIGIEFQRELEDIKDKRIAMGLDKRRVSTNILTNIMTKHSDWARIKEDTINLDLSKEVKSNEEIKE